MPLGITALLGWTLVVAYGDMRTRRIANRLAYPFVLLALGWLVVTGESVIGVGWPHALAGVGGALLLGVPGHLKGALGGGDVKLLAALGLSLGTLGLLVLVALTAALLGLWHALAPRLPARVQKRLAASAPGLSPEQGRYAYAPFVALALVLLVLVALGLAG